MKEFSFVKATRLVEGALEAVGWRLDEFMDAQALRMPVEFRFWTRKQIADAFKRDIQTVRNWARAGWIEETVIEGRVLIEHSQYEKLVKLAKAGKLRGKPKRKDEGL